MRVVVIGANGQLGHDLTGAFSERGWQVAALTHAEICVEDSSSVERALRESRPTAIVNTAAYHNVPKCEEHPEQAWAVNAQGALNVARVARRLDAEVVYYSTDYVFDGARRAPYVESDLPNPLNVYGCSKLAGEYLTLNYNPQSYVIRMSGLYGTVPCRAKGGNFVTTMQRAARSKPEVTVVDDEVLTPTPTLAVARRTVDILESKRYGVYHLTCEGECSWYEFAVEIFDALGLDTPLRAVKSQPGAVRRPAYSVLENRNLAALGIAPMPHWRTALRDFLSAIN